MRILLLFILAFIYGSHGPVLAGESQPKVAAQSERRIALVIGVSNYLKAPRLANPGNDAVDISTTLKRLNFEVHTHLDLTGQQIQEVVRGFAKKASGADVALFFFAGHGMQLQDRNILLGTDADLSSAAAIQRTGIAADDVLRSLEDE